MPNLHTVIHRFYPYDRLPLIGPALPRLQFPALRVLHWCGLAYTQATTLLSLLQPGPRDLQALSIRCEYTSDAAAASALLAAVRATCAPQTLTSLALHSINASSASLAAPVTPALAASALAASLCPFTRMQECQITGLPVALDDQLLGDLSASWPALRRLELVAGPLRGLDDHARGPAVLAALCPRLEHLEVEIGAWWPEGGPAPTRSATGHRAQTVVVYCAHLEALQDDPHEGRCTAWVRGVFPHAQVMLVDRREPH
ncbi:hypothetical protein EWM64_g10459 [Hericium alpestre]|uniref:F-box domain-containing protein n=1 Tax=Hericium alpestre TaxID=135208 RepID=A0A4Y9ZIA2_9AGAM|nr:hypothetical protein EWM64_g10459 [Hericium alpestre]